MIYLLATMLNQQYAAMYKAMYNPGDPGDTMNYSYIQEQTDFGKLLHK